MARDLSPKIIAFDHSLMKGAFVLLPNPAPTGAGASKAPTSTMVLRFQYNPESITRNRTGAWESRKNQKDAKPTPAEKSQQSSMRGGGLFAKAETIAMKLVFDATELALKTDSAAADLGVLPELAALEGIAIAEAPKDGPGKKKDPKQGTKLTALNPREVLLVLGSRVFPVIVTSMNIAEKRFSTTLAPLRAEVDLQMQILEATEVAGNAAIAAAYDQLVSARASRATLALAPGATLSSEGTLGVLAMEVLAQALRQDPSARGDE